MPRDADSPCAGQRVHNLADVVCGGIRVAHTMSNYGGTYQRSGNGVHGERRIRVLSAQGTYLF